jgi:GTP-binding protein
LHLVSAELDDPAAAYREVRKEVEAFARGLSEKKEVVILSKTDLVSEEDREAKMKMLAKETGKEVLSVSIEDSVSLKSLADKLTSLLPKAR